MSFPLSSKCQKCNAPATIVITDYDNKITESFCDKHFDESRYGFVLPTKHEPIQFIFVEDKPKTDAEVGEHG